jgi:hypothetical protein
VTSIAWQWSWPGLDAHLLVSQSVADLLQRYRQQRFDVEHGGQLFVDPSNNAGLVLALATPPHNNDRAGKNWLELNCHRCREEIELANTNGLRLVGYWHTHPQQIPVLSPTDIKSFYRFAVRYAQDLPHPLAVIVGNANSPKAIRAWSFREGQHVEAICSNYSS